MNKKITFLVIVGLLLLTLVTTACMREDEVCNYDGICIDDETDNCADCKNVLGRNIDVITNDAPDSPVNSP